MATAAALDRSPGPRPTRATELTTARAFVRFVITRPSLVGLAAAVIAALGLRLVLGMWGWADAAVVLVMAALIGPAEWAIHHLLFHAPSSSRRQRWLGTGKGHRRHHRDPADLTWLLLAPAGIVVFALVLGLVGAAVAWAVATVVDAALVGPVATGVVVAWAALLHYELAHLLFHARIRPRLARYRRLRAHHLAHHHREASQRLGVTTTTGDRLFGTMGRSAGRG
ncbi:MAG: sterol desaturase family protein [Actinomycetota bacterium]